MSNTQSYLVAVTVWSSYHAWVDAADEAAAITKAETLWQENEGAFLHKDGGIECTTVLESRKVQVPGASPPKTPSEITLERAIAVIADAEMALSDIDTARRKGYLAQARDTVFAFMDDWRIVQRHAAAIVAGKVQP